MLIGNMGVTYKVVYIREAEKDLINIYRYIALTLEAAEAAKKQADRIINAIRSLNKMPLRHKLYQNEPWHSRGLRVLPVDNYLVFYKVVEKEKMVAIVRIMYGRRNIDWQLAGPKIDD